MAQAPGDGHHYFEEMAVAHVLGGLGESDGRLFRSHLLECGDCRARVGELRALAHDLADVERDERRVRAAKAIETKRREAEEANEEEAAPPPTVRRGFPRVAGLVGIMLILTLAGWVFMLRGTVSTQEAAVDSVQRAAAVLEFGQDVDSVAVLADGLDVRVRSHEGNLAVLIDGVTDDGVYVLSQLNAAGDTVERGHPVQATDGRIFLLAPLRQGARRVVVTAPDGDSRTDADERRLMEADL
jgi:hypothetical protein